MSDEKKPLTKAEMRAARAIDVASPPANEAIVAAKIEAVKASRMPDSEKERMIRKLQASTATFEQKMRFGAYANMKGISMKMRSAMQAYPKARNVTSATVEQWDEIFKDF